MAHPFRTLRGIIWRALGRVVRRLDSLSLHNPYIAGKLLPARDSTVLKPGDLPSARDGLPVPPADLLYGYSPQQYLDTGREDVATMLDMIREAGGDPESFRMVLELGSGPARMLRAMPRHPDGEFWGVDISASHIRWCQNYLPPPMRFATITTAPHLPFEDNVFDLTYAGSVFTHIDALADAWMLELRRVTVLGGYVYATVHDEHSLDVLLTRMRHDPDHSSFVRGIVKFMRRTNITNKPYRQFAFGVDPESQVFHDLEDLVERWSLVLDPVSTRREAYAYQTGVLLRKRRSGARRWSVASGQPQARE